MAQSDIEFYDCMEIRMGSPYRLCKLRATGGWHAALGTRDWQDKFARSPDGRYVALVYWDTRGNDPGFRVLTVDTESGETRESKRVAGCCDSIAWQDGRFTCRTAGGEESEVAVN